ncbi:ABC transporter substrate-binding protein [uncultured Roseobacter sp.]|uniref:ABC transporter substrate-binding protein n=1 Tax=uncultured Roseobacter sp. TaxID=114847 RepID=UPI00262FE054|nr:ABC transporter substrate-binding protein [uncultured Roseobacter sp.]
MLKNLILVALIGTVMPGTAIAETPLRIGLLFGFTGPIESMAPEVAASAELALSEASASGLFLEGRRIEPVRADSTCIDTALAVSAAERLVTSEGVAALIGADCSGAASAVVAQVAVPHGILSISPTATSPGLTELDDRGLFFRTAPSDARQGEVLADVLKARGIETVAVTYTANDYGAGLASSFRDAFTRLGGKVTIELPHTDGKGDYSAEVGALAASGAKVLVVAGYADQGGRAILQTALDLGAFDRFVLPDGMVADSILDAFGGAIAGAIGTLPGTSAAASASFEAMLRENGIDGQGPYRAEAYDAAAVLVLAMQAARSTNSADIARAIHFVANAPGTPIGTGEMAKALRILRAGGQIDYVGASSVEFTPDGDASGTYREVVVTGDGFQTVRNW